MGAALDILEPRGDFLQLKCNSFQVTVIFGPKPGKLDGKERITAKRRTTPTPGNARTIARPRKSRNKR
jgi:hypothetical protein